MNNNLTLHNLGKNKTILESSDGPVFLYEYKYSFNDECTNTTFSNDINKLKEQYLKEINMKTNRNPIDEENIRTDHDGNNDGAYAD